MATHERRQQRSLKERANVAVPLLIAWSVGVLVIAAVASQPSARASELLMDPAFTIGAKWYTGLVSNLGVLAWTVAVVAAFAGSWICELGGRHSAGRFLRRGGVVGAVLLFDDLFMLHAVLLPSEFAIPKPVGQALIGLALLGWAWAGRTEIRRTHTHLLVAAAAGMAMSYAVDAIWAPLPGDAMNVVEDGAKFLGVLAWATYFVVTARDIAKSVFVDALLTWPDAAYESVYEQLRDEDKPAVTADADAGADAEDPAKKAVLR